MDNSKILSEIAKKSAPVFAMMAAIKAPEVAETVFTGKRELELGNVKLPSGTDKEEMDSDMYTYLGNVYTGQDLAAIRESVHNHYAATNGNEPYDKSKLIESMEAVTGGIAKINSFSIELPRGVDESDMEDFIDGFNSDMVESIGGIDNRTPKDAAKMIRDGIWRSRPGGNYAVITPFGELMQDGKPLRIKYDPMFKRRTLTFEEFQAKTK